MLRPKLNRFMWEYEQNMYGGNRQWVDAEEAKDVGRNIAGLLIERHGIRESDDESPSVKEVTALAVLKDALDVVDYAALPTERRANIMHGVIDTLAASGVLGGNPEWAPSPEALATEEVTQ
jgi:hypothetical protein